MDNITLRTDGTEQKIFPVEYLLENLPFGLLILDKDFCVKWVNENIFRFKITNLLPHDDIIGRNVMEIKLFNNALVLKELVKLKNGEGFERKIEISDPKSAEKLFVKIKGRPVFENDVLNGGIIFFEQFAVEDKIIREEYFRSENLNDLLRTLYDAYFITDSIGNIKYFPTWNKESYFKFPNDNIPKNIFDVFPGNSTLKLKHVFYNLNVKKQRQTEDLVSARYEGDLIFNSLFTPFLDEEGKVIFVLVLLKNETEQRATEKVIKEETASLQRYHLMASKIPDALILADMQGNIQIWNDAARGLLNIEDSHFNSFIGHYFQTFSKDVYKKIIAEIKRKGTWEGEFTVIRDKTLIVYINIKMSFILESNEKLVAIICSNVTEKNKGIRQIKENEEQYRNVFNTAIAPVCVINKDGSIKFANPKFINEFGFNEVTMRAAKLNNIFAPWERKGLTDLLENKEGGSGKFVLGRTGSYNTPFEVIISNYYDYKDSLRYSVVHFNELSGLYEAEKNKHTLAGLIEASGDGILLLDKDKILEVNSVLLKMFGYDFNSDILGKPVKELIDSKDKMLVENYIANLFERSGSPGKIEFLAKGNRKSPFKIELTAVRYEANSQKYIIATLRDLSVEKKAEETLKKVEEKYQTVSDKINVSLWAAERQKGKIRVLFYTTAIKKITGYEADNFINHTTFWFKIMHPDDIDVLMKKYRRFLNNKNEFAEQMEFRIITKHGNIVWVENKLNITRDNEGRADKIYGVLTNITKAKKSEEELRNTADDLKRLNETKDRFISIVSHDLRNPFSSIMGYTDLLLGRNDLTEEKRTEYVQFIRESAGNMLDLVNSLLDWTRLQTGNIRFEPKRMNAREVIDHCLHMLSGSALKKHIELVSLVQKETFVHADKNLLLQVFNNLVSNALKFTENGGKVTISANPVLEKKEFEFMVTDTGTGIKEEDIEKLFKVDSKFTLRGTEGEKGSGLGLSLVHEIVEKHGGEISVNSRYGFGTTFKFTVPVSSTSIVLADDSKMDRMLYVKLLSNFLPGYKVIEAENGEQAFSAIENYSPALVISDHYMPYKNGYDLVRDLKDSALKYKPPVMILSSDVTPAIADDYHELGVEHVFSKPVNLKVFKAAMENTLKQAIMS